jgi:hypothetical protein
MHSLRIYIRIRFWRSLISSNSGGQKFSNEVRIFSECILHEFTFVFVSDVHSFKRGPTSLFLQCCPVCAALLWYKWRTLERRVTYVYVDEYKEHTDTLRAGIAQLVLRLSYGIRLSVRPTDLYPLPHNDQIDYGTYPASCTMSTRSCSLRRQSGRGVEPATHLYLVQRLRMVELYLHSPIRLHKVVFN